MKRIIILSLAICLVTLSTSAQIKWTLRQCIDYAIENNIEIKQQVLQVENAKNNLNTSKMSRLPDLNSSVGSQFNWGTSTSMATNITQSTNAFNTDIGIASSIPIFTGFRIPNEIKSREFSLMAATENLWKAQENLELQVTSLYLDVLFKKEIKKVYLEQLDLTSKQLNKTQIMVEAGKVPRSQEYDIVSQQAKDNLNLIVAGNDLDLSLLNLAQALSLMDIKAFDIVEPIIEKDNIERSKVSLVSPDDIYNIAIEIKPHVKVGEYQVASSESQLKVAQSGYYPTLTLQGGYSTGYTYAYGSRWITDLSGNKMKKNTPFTTQLKNNGREYIGISLSIPIFNRFKTRNDVRAARLDIEDRELDLDNIKLSLFKEIQQAYQSATSAQSKYASSEKALKAAEESYYYAEQRYDIGKMSVFEFSESQMKLLSSKSEQIQAKYDFIFRAKILDFYRGEQIDIN